MLKLPTPQDLFRDYGRLPVTIGVTGHRNLSGEQLEAARKKFEALVVEMRQRLWPNSPFVFFSALAEGADQLIAGEVLQREGVVIAPLPMPLEAYKKTMNVEAAEKLDQLLGMPKCFGFVLPQTPVPAEWIAKGYTEEQFRYDQLGRFLARHSHILIAVWEEGSAAGPGGTTDVVQYQRHGVPGKGILHLGDSGPVYHIPVIRQGSPPAAAAEPRWLGPFGEDGNALEERLWRDALAKIDLLNGECRVWDRQGAGAHTDARELEEKRHMIADAQEQLLNAGERNLLHAYLGANRLALSYSGKFWSCAKWLYWSFGIALVGAGFGQMDLKDDNWKFVFWAVVSLGLLIVGGVALHVKRRRFGLRHLYCRALAESLRVRFYWSLAGISPPVLPIFLRPERWDFHWARFGLRGLDWFGYLRREVEPEAERLEVVRRKWIEEQRIWLEKKCVQQERKNSGLQKFTDFLSYSLIGFSAVSLAWAIGEMVIAHSSPGATILQNDYRKEVMGGLLALSGIIAARRGYLETRAYAAQAREYRLLAAWFRRVERYLEQKKGEADYLTLAREQLEELGELALEENANWVMLHREKQLEPQTAG